MSRADRWWRPATRRRPPQRARQREWHSDRELNDTFEAGCKAGASAERDQFADLGVHSADEVLESFSLGYECGQADERKRWQDLDLIRWARDADPDGFRQLSDALAEGGIDAARRLAASWGFTYGDDLLDVAEETGVTPLADVDPGELVDGLEAWLRDREGDG